MKTKKKPTKIKKKKSTAPKSGLSGFMVVWRHSMDDVPLGFYADEKDAIRVADKISFRAAYKIARNLDIDCSTPICFAVVPFENGTPTNMFVLDREDDAGRTISTSPVQRALRTQRKKTDSDRRRR